MTVLIRHVAAIVLIAVLAVVAGGCGSSGTSTTTKAGHGKAGVGRLAVADLLTNLADTKAAAVLCLKPAALRSDAGESFGSPGVGNPGRTNRRAVRGALASTILAELHRGDRVALSLVQTRLDQVRHAVARGLAEAARDPGLLLHGTPPGFVRAAALADRYGLSTC